jgi:hypothetical protein
MRELSRYCREKCDAEPMGCGEYLDCLGQYKETIKNST